MDLDSMPELYKEAFSQSLLNLDKLKEDDNIGYHKQGDIQNLLNATQIQQNLILEDILTILPHLQITGGQEGLVNRSLTQITAKWEESLRLSRNVMLIIDISNRKERGEMSHDMTIDLINTPLPELIGAVSVVPETILRNIKEFTGIKTELDDLDMILEGFLKSVFEAGQTQKLTHSAQKELIIRKLAPNCILLINSYLDNSNKTISDISLHQLIGILEQVYIPNSQPSEALVKLQSLGKVQNRDYLSHCAVISRLVRLSVRKEANEESKKALKESRCAEYMKHSLSESDSHLIRKLEIKRSEEQKQSLTSLKIARYLTQYHSNKGNGQDDFDLSTVNRVEVSENKENTSGFKTFQRGRSQFRPRGSLKGQLSPNDAYFASYRGQKGNFRPNNGPNRHFSNQHVNEGFPQGNEDFQYGNGKYQHENEYLQQDTGNEFQYENQYFSPENDDLQHDTGNEFQYENQYFSPENDDCYEENKFNQNTGTFRKNCPGRFQGQKMGFDPDNQGQDYIRRGQFRQNTGQNYIVPMYKDAKVNKDMCVMCGSLSHFWSSWRCKYRGIVGPTPRPRADIPAPVCKYHGRFLHPVEHCLGDIDVDSPNDVNNLRIVRSKNTQIFAENEECDEQEQDDIENDDVFDEIDFEDDETISFN